jgi:uncharacterized membrane protein YfcA
MAAEVYGAGLPGSPGVHVSIGAFVVAASAVAVGSTVQGSVGFGLNLLAFPLAVAVVRREHHRVDGEALPWMLVGAVPGTVLGLLIVGHIDAPDLAIVVGGITLIGVTLSIVSPPLAVTPGTSAVAGFVSNLFGTASSVGGPPVALLFQHRPGPVARSTLGGFFATSAALSLIGYVVIGVVSLDQLRFALELAPFMVGGLWASRHVHPLVDAGWLRPGVLALSGVAGAVAILRAVL